MLNAFQICLKGFKLKKFVVKPKTTQSIEGSAQLVEEFESYLQRLHQIVKMLLLESFLWWRRIYLQ